MDTFTNRVNPWEYRLTNVGQTTSLPGELTMNWGLIGVFAGFAAFALLLCLLGELLAGAGGPVGWLLGAVLVPPCGAGDLRRLLQHLLGSAGAGGDDERSR